MDNDLNDPGSSWPWYHPEREPAPVLVSGPTSRYTDTEHALSSDAYYPPNAALGTVISGPTTGRPSPRHSQKYKNRNNGKKGAGAGVGGIIAKLLLAAKSVLMMAKFSFLFSMVISIGVYAIFWGLPFAAGFVALLLIHEMGHVAELRRQGVPATAPMFIPFLGAMIAMKQMPRSVVAEAKMAIAGPIAGSLASLVVLAWAHASHSQLIMALAYVGFFINLFNLLPMNPLDGGRVAGALHPSVWFVGIIGAIALFLWRPNPIFLLIVVVGVISSIGRWTKRHQGQNDEYFSVPAKTKAAIATVYISVGVLCVWGMATAYIATPTR